jgi:DNA-binding transcriptional LysR family regulator
MAALDSNGLAMLVAIVDAGSLSKAAANLKVTRGNISYHLAQLERTAGLQLMRRTTRRLELTEVGHRLYQHGCRIRDELAEANEAMSTLGQSLHGAVRISVPTGFGQLVMATWFIEFQRTYPDIDLHVLFDNRVDDLLRHEVDVAVRVMSTPPLELVARELGPVQQYACMSRTYFERYGAPQRLEDLTRSRLITSSAQDRKLVLKAQRDELRQAVTLEPSLVSENFPFLRQAILADLGIGIVPDYVVRRDLDDGSIVRVLADWRLDIYGSRMFILRRQDRFPTLALRTLIDFILAKAGINL